MRSTYQARRVSKERVHSLRKTGRVKDNIILSLFNGFIIVELRGSNLGDGPVLSLEDADTEVQQAWCLDAPRRVAEARKLLGLETRTPQLSLAEVGV